MKVRDVVRRIRRDYCSWQLRDLRDRGEIRLTKLGSRYGGWTVPEFALRPGATAVCVGVGEDMTFDVELNKKGLVVYTLDPTPRSREHVQQLLRATCGAAPVPVNRSSTDFYDLRGFDPCRLRYLDLGMWNEDTVQRFYAPENLDHVSHSIVNLQRTQSGFDAKCVTLRTLSRLCDLPEIYLLKLDVEGAEYAVVKDIVQNGPLPKVLCFEFDELRNPLDGAFMSRIRETIDMVKRAGYRFQHIEISNLLFVRA